MKSLEKFILQKKQGKKWSVLTAYDAPTAELLEKSGVDWILVGDSLGMVLLGYASTVPVTMDEMIHHAKAVRRGAQKSFIIGDLPLKGVQKGPSQALGSARRFICEAGMNAVKLEWGVHAEKTAALLVKNKIPVMGHVGLTPQTVGKKSFGLRGKEAGSALEILRQALVFERLGAFSVLAECVPANLTDLLARTLKIPVVGIGAGSGSDGQVLVFHDLVGIFTKFKPRFVKQYAKLYPVMEAAVKKYTKEVLSGQFPGKKQSFFMAQDEAILFKRRATDFLKKKGFLNAG